MTDIQKKLDKMYGVPFPSPGRFRAWRREMREYRRVMTDIGRSFLMREMRLRRVPGMSRLQREFRVRFPAQREKAKR